jgi:hypothetical protein
MSFTITCNVNILKVVDIRVRPPTGNPPGRFSTLFTGPQSVHGSPLTWDFIVLERDSENSIQLHSTTITNNFSTLSANAIFISTFTNSTISNTSTFVYNNFEIINTNLANITLNEITNLSNFYIQNCNIETNNIIQIAGSIEVIDTQINNEKENFTFLSRTTGDSNILLSTINGFNNFILPQVSNQSSINSSFSSIIRSTSMSTTRGFFLDFSNQYLTYSQNEENRRLQFSTLISKVPENIETAFQSNASIYSNLIRNEIEYSSSNLSKNFSTLSTILSVQFSTTKNIVEGLFISSASTGVGILTNSINLFLQPFSTLVLQTLSTVQSSVIASSDINSNLSTSAGNIADIHIEYIESLSSGIRTLKNFSTISRPQLFYRADISFNNRIISSLIYDQSLSTNKLTNVATDLVNFMSTNFSTNTNFLSSLYFLTVSTTFQSIVKAQRENNQEALLQAFFNHSTAVRSTLLQNYSFLVTSENMSIRNTRNLTTIVVPNITSTILLISSGMRNLSTQMNTITSTNFINLLTYTFKTFREESEATIVQTNKAETEQTIEMNNREASLQNLFFGDMFFSNISTLVSENKSTSVFSLNSSLGSVFETQRNTVNYSSQISSISTLYGIFPPSFISTSIRFQFSTLETLKSNVIVDNTLALSTQSTLVTIFNSSISTHLALNLVSTLSSFFSIRYLSISNNTLVFSNVLNNDIVSLGNAIDDYKFGGLGNMSNAVVANTELNSNRIQTIFGNSITLAGKKTVSSTMRTLSSIFNFGKMSTFIASAVMTDPICSPLLISHFNNYGKNMTLFVNSTFNEVIVNKLRIEAVMSTTISNTMSTVGLDLAKFQDFAITISTMMSNPSPNYELYFLISIAPSFTQSGNIYLNLATPTEEEKTIGKFVTVLQGVGNRKDISRREGLLKYSYIYMNRSTFITYKGDFTSLVE